MDFIYNPCDEVVQTRQENKDVSVSFLGSRVSYATLGFQETGGN